MADGALISGCRQWRGRYVSIMRGGGWLPGHDRCWINSPPLSSRPRLPRVEHRLLLTRE